MKKVRNILWHTVLNDALKTETSNFVLDLSLHWKPVESSEQCCCTCMSGLTEDNLCCMILYALKLIQFVVRDTSKKRIAVVKLRENEGNSLLATSVDKKELFSNSVQLTEPAQRHKYLIRASTDSVLSKSKPRVLKD